MGHKQKHRGKHPADDHLFGFAQVPVLRQALHDYSWLISRGYGENGSLKLVGDRYQLRERQRHAVHRAACLFEAVESRQSREVNCADLKGKTVCIDGYNLLISVESALSGGYLFIGLDGAVRDIASIHGTYKRVEETFAALELIGQTLAGLEVDQVKWYLDAPVSNSGRLKGFLEEKAAEAGWKWEVEVVKNPDWELAESGEIVISSDSWVLDHAAAWANLTAYLLETQLKEAMLVDLRQLEG
ncbi:MAG: DUF434 domain-containing protein [Bacteroidia bacterium]|nr:DUF434 domain-containing protein [Bacteroidia bacterium]